MKSKAAQEMLLIGAVVIAGVYFEASRVAAQRSLATGQLVTAWDVIRGWLGMGSGAAAAAALTSGGQGGVSAGPAQAATSSGSGVLTGSQFRNAETMIYQQSRLSNYSATLNAMNANMRRAMHL